MGNFEIQDLVVSIDYAETRRGQTQATVTVRPTDRSMALDKSSTKLTALVATATNGRNARIALRAAEDGTLTGTGILPTLGNTDALALMVSRNAGFRFSVPVYDERNGWNIEQGSAWKVEEGETLTGSAEGDGWRIDISMDWPLDVDITIEG